MTTDLDEDEKQSLAANLAWLASTGPDDWHRVVLDFNWDAPLYVLDWIVRQAECDLATALTVFWRGEPECWLVEEGSSDEEPNGFSYLNQQICVYIANRVRQGGYTRSEITFAPDTWTKEAYVQLVAAEQPIARPNFRTHPDLIRDRRGREVDLSDDFYRRYPEAFHHSAFSEAFAADIERGVYETPRSIALMKKVDEVERATLRRLPAWLKPEPDLQEIQSEAGFLFLNVIFIGLLLVALFTGGLSGAGGAVGWIVGVGLSFYLAYSARSSLKDIRRGGWQVSASWLAGALTVSLAIGGGLGLLLLRHLGALREAYGTFAVSLVGIAVVLPALWFVSRVFVGWTVSRATLR